MTFDLDIELERLVGQVIAIFIESKQSQNYFKAQLYGCETTFIFSQPTGIEFESGQTVSVRVTDLNRDNM